MILRNIAARDRRALTVAACGVLVMLCWTLAVRPYLDATGAARERLESSRDLLQRELQVVAEAEQLPPVWETGSKQLLRAAPRLLSDPSDGAANAALAGYIQRAAELSRVLIRQVEPLPTSNAGNDVTAIELRVRAESDLEGLLSFLEALESGPKLVRLGNLQIQSASSGSVYTTAGPDALSLQLTVTGLSLGDALRPGQPRNGSTPEAP